MRIAFHRIFRRNIPAEGLDVAHNAEVLDVAHDAEVLDVPHSAEVLALPLSKVLYVANYAKMIFSPKSHCFISVTPPLRANFQILKGSSH